jgi:hypothetical protein
MYVYMCVYYLWDKGEPLMMVGRSHTTYCIHNYVHLKKKQEYLTVPERFEGRDQKRVREVLYLM